MNTLGKRIISIRCDRSRDEFAGLYGVHRNTLAKWEGDTLHPGDSILHKIASDNGVPFEWLLYGFIPIKNEGISPSAASDSEKMGDMSPIEKGNSFEKLDNIKQKWATVSHFDIQQENATLNREIRELMRENATILRENGDLRVTIERTKMEVERRDARIAELERELVRVLKGDEAEDMASAG